MSTSVSRVAGRKATALLIVLTAVWVLCAGAQTPQTEVQRGEYLARAGDCVSCHTAKGGAPYAGGLRMDTPFGYLLAPNITPDPETGIGNWSADDFYRALHDGLNKRGQDMYPVMPYDFYTKVTRADSDAIFAYLKSVPPVRNAVDINHLRFPFDLRWSMVAWRELYFDEGTYKADPAQSAAWNRGAYLVEGLGHCSACHSPRNVMGAIEKDKAFTGANDRRLVRAQSHREAQDRARRLDRGPDRERISSPVRRRGSRPRSARWRKSSTTVSST